MFKVFLSVRNRLAITKKCIESLYNHSDDKFLLFVYDNLTDYMIDEHFMFFNHLYKKGMVTQVTFNTSQSTFNAFSKAASCNQFGLLHKEDPNKHNYSFLTILDNDMIMAPGWDTMVKNAWIDIKQNELHDVKIVSQLPGGIKYTNPLPKQIAGVDARVGKLGGSGCWNVKTDFFDDVGFLDLRQLVGRNKMHDQLYWRKCEAKTRGKPYILGLNHVLAYHCGNFTGSICNELTRRAIDPNLSNIIQFKQQEEEISKQTFEEFYNKVTKSKRGW